MQGVEVVVFKTHACRDLKRKSFVFRFAICNPSGPTATVVLLWSVLFVVVRHLVAFVSCGLFFSSAWLFFDRRHVPFLCVGVFRWAPCPLSSKALLRMFKLQSSVRRSICLLLSVFKNSLTWWFFSFVCLVNLSSFMICLEIYSNFIPHPHFECLFNLFFVVLSLVSSFTARVCRICILKFGLLPFFPCNFSRLLFNSFSRFCTQVYVFYHADRPIDRLGRVLPFWLQVSGFLKNWFVN